MFQIVAATTLLTRREPPLPNYSAIDHLRQRLAQGLDQSDVFLINSVSNKDTTWTWPVESYLLH